MSNEYVAVVLGGLGTSCEMLRYKTVAAALIIGLVLVVGWREAFWGFVRTSGDS